MRIPTDEELSKLRTESLKVDIILRVNDNKWSNVPDFQKKMILKRLDPFEVLLSQLRKEIK